jgi:hypothetical protein
MYVAFGVKMFDPLIARPRPNYLIARSIGDVRFTVGTQAPLPPDKGVLDIYVRLLTVMKRIVPHLLPCRLGPGLPVIRKVGRLRELRAPLHFPASHAMLAI